MDNPFSPQVAITRERRGILAGRNILGSFNIWLERMLQFVKLAEEEERSAGIHVGPLTEEEQRDAGLYVDR